MIFLWKHSLLFVEECLEVGDGKERIQIHSLVFTSFLHDKIVVNRVDYIRVWIGPEFFYLIYRIINWT